MSSIHNFVIIAHIDHGKSTLADRMLELTHTVEKRQMKEQLLDQMELEREKGITIKLQPVRMLWQGNILNLIDTPGHVDFQYEVSRSLQSVEAAVLLVDASQGVQAQTISNLYLALEQNLKIIPVLNKIDLPAANVPAVKKEVSQLLGTPENEILSISAKTGQGVDQLLNKIIRNTPTASENFEDNFRSLIFDSVYDDFRGVVTYVRVVDGLIATGDKISFLGTNISDKVTEVGYFKPGYQPVPSLHAGEIGYIITNVKDVSEARVGDTIVKTSQKEKTKPLTTFKVPQPKLFAGLYPENGEQFPELREAIGKLQLNDASLTATQERSEALGQGYRCGFLGMLHLEIVQERLSREYELQLVITTPSVEYQLELTDGQIKKVKTPSEFPDPSHIAAVSERFVKAEIITPDSELGAVFELLKQHEGKMIKQEHIGDKRTLLQYSLPLRELVVDLYDLLKSATSGYGSLSFEMHNWQPADVVKLSILINQEPVEALSVIVPRHKAVSIGRRVVTKLKNVVPRQQFAVPLQAAVGGSVVARETLSALRKDVTSGLYGGDVTRKRKLLEKQKKGKKRLSSQGSIKIPTSAYMAVFKR